MTCPFCNLAAPPTAENTHAVAFRDAYPVSEGHTLVIPRRHVPGWFDATRAEQLAMLDLVERVKDELDASHAPDGYNIGINAGEAAGQTVMHLHVHVIPRYRGDVDDPAGGVRFVIPERGDYRNPGRLPRTTRHPRLARGGVQDPFLAHLAPLLAHATDVRLLSAFVRASGVRAIASRIEAALERGAHVRVLTGDYLHLTQAEALHPLLDLARATEDDERHPGLLELRIVEVDALEGSSRSFHPKAWLLAGPGFQTAFVGSSNLSHAALHDGVEWNLRVDRRLDAAATAEVFSGYEALWATARPVDEAWLATYTERARHTQRELPFDVEHDDGPPPQPHQVQEEALEALRMSRQDGRDRALVVMATGLGKTWLAAFDLDALRQELGRVPRTLWLAHRKELLVQAARTVRRIFPTERFGWLLGEHESPVGDIVFASVQKLSKPARLASIPADTFDVIVVDEVHHAAAESYKRVLAHFEARFRLGLTATPARADARDILGPFDDHVAYEADIGVGIRIDPPRLVPFAYFGIADTTDYAPIPWRNRRFDADVLAQAMQTQERMDQLWRAWEAHPGERTLVFCCSIAHARFVAGWLSDKQVSAVAVHSGPESEDRTDALTRLGEGELAALCTVDLFNEGIDVPLVDRVVMLRPTESPVVFLQQLGRGLRVAAGKQRLTVIDFVGNHHMFLDRVRLVLNLLPSDRPIPVSALLQDAPLELPSGCSVDFELEAIELLRKLLPSGEGHAVKRAYRELRASHGERPLAGELARLGLNPNADRIRREHGTWLGFVESEGDLAPDELDTWRRHGTWFTALHTTSMTKCFKMVVLQVLVEADGLAEGMDEAELATRCHALLCRSPELFADLEGVSALPDPRHPAPDAWLRYWRGNPIAAWCRGGWFRRRDGRFEPTFQLGPAELEPFSRLTAELVDWRLVQYRRRRRDERASMGKAFTCKLITNKRHPILKLPDRARFPELPEGEHDVRVQAGRFWRFRFVKYYVNVAHPVGSQENQLGDLLREWFGVDAGQPGTDHRVRFTPAPDGWLVEPLESENAHVIALPVRGRLPAFPVKEMAAGYIEAAVTGRVEPAESVVLPGSFGEREFAMRVHGTSMSDPATPERSIEDGDWLVMRWSQGVGAEAVLDRVVLVERGNDEGATHLVKRLVRTAHGVVLRSYNPEVGDQPWTSADQPLAVLRRRVRPTDIAPEIGASADSIAELLGLSEEPSGGASRVDGHLVLALDRPGQAKSPVSVVVEGFRPRASEPAYVVVQCDEGWVYRGVARQSGQEWTLPELDFATWVALRPEGKRTGLSRPLPALWAQAARDLVASLMRAIGPGGTVGDGVRTLTIVERAPRGGLVVRSERAQASRTVSLLDIGWVLFAVDRYGERVDEAMVNVCRYLEGTPRASTRWIDTGNALVLVHGA